MTRAINVLRNKRVEITDEEYLGVCIAILLHDIGHGPFSHGLEKKIIPFHHEEISIAYMELLNDQFDNQLSLGISIFKNNYSKKFLHQLVSSQLDMDRMDYLNRDSFFTGVVEGKVGYDRIISMLNVSDDKLVVEEKALYSVEKFLMARRIMYWQVYLHKTALAAEQMMGRLFEEYRNLASSQNIGTNLSFFLDKAPEEIKKMEMTSIIQRFNTLDDHDIWYALKNLVYSKDRFLASYAQRILERQLFKIELSKLPFTSDYEQKVRQDISTHFKEDEDDAAKYLIIGTESNQAYTTAVNEILILKKTSQIIPFSELSENLINTDVMVKYFLCYPRIY
jgi:HD superfamily phosphohydrolase